MLELTPMEKQCLLLRSRGLTNKEMAKTLGIAVSVVAVVFIALILSQITLDDNMKWRKK